MHEMPVEENLIAKSRGAEYHYSIAGAIGEPDAFTELLNCLRFATQEDIIYLHINSPGGKLYTAVQIIHAIKDCACLVVGCAEGMVASGASMIFFSCTGLYVQPYCTFIIHDGSSGNVGKVNENLISAHADAKMLSSVYNDVYSPWLTKKEINKVLKGQDLYLTSDQVDKRINKVLEADNDNQEGDEIGQE